MLRIIVPEEEIYDEKNNLFFIRKETVLQLEHSLVSISKWESRWHKPYISREDKTTEEVMDYIRCMTLTQNVPPEVYAGLTNKNIQEITEYIDNPMSATKTRPRERNGGINEPLTSEIIYYSMIVYGIPVEFQKWHLNRLLTLIRVCEIKNGPAKKMSQRELMSRNAALNEQRKRILNTRG